MKRIDEYTQELTSMQEDIFYEIYRRSEIVKVVENVKDGNYRNAIVFKKYIAEDEFKPYNLDGKHCFIVSVATYGKSFNEYFLNSKNVTVYVTNEKTKEYAA